MRNGGWGVSAGQRGFGRRTARRWTGRFVVGVLAVFLCACTSEVPGLPSLSSVPPSEEISLVDVAKAYHQCLSSAGVPAEVAPDGAGDLVIVSFLVKDGWYAVRAEGRVNIMSGDGGYDPRNALHESAIAEFEKGSGPGLLVNGIDYTPDYLRCLEESGYDEDAAMANPPNQYSVHEIERIVRANNRWAACARANGWPEVEDTPMPTRPVGIGDMEHYPYVFIPLRITEDELRYLIDACPVFLPEEQEALWEWLRESPDADIDNIPFEFESDPQVTFWESREQQINPHFTLSEEDNMHMGRLMEILNESMIEYGQAREAERQAEEQAKASDGATGG